ncbi:MAG: hypothetical protein Cons2KO_02440 [Congregibacter sp.]
MTRQILAIVLLIPFLALTGWSLMEVGVMGILNTHETPGGLQVFVDLIISLILLLTFLVPHAKAHGRNPWVWVVLTVFLGSISPLVYFALGREKSA